MSLTSLLLGQQHPIDSELDSLFKLPVAKAPIPGPSKEISVKKRKLDQEAENSTDVVPKRSKSNTEEKQNKSPKAKKSLKTDAKSHKAHSESDQKDSPSPKKSKGKGKEKELESDSDNEDELENAYLKGHTSQPQGDESGSDEDEDPTKLVHEASAKKNKKARGLKTKHVPLEETAELRDQRTIFVGNLPIELASKKPLQKQLKRHITSFLPTAKIESLRFRSIPFQAPTTKMPSSDDEEEKGQAAKSTQASKKEPRAHDKERASIWRSKRDEEDEVSVNKDEKRFQTPAQKKKIAFINQEFHSSAGTVNAYIVFAHPPSVEGRPANLPPPPPVMDPYRAARLAAEKCDSTIFMERMIRVDLVVKNKGAVPSDDVTRSVLLETDPRLSIFVGNLEFASKEEDLRVFFEGVVSAERGPPPVSSSENQANDTEAAGNAKKPSTWVTRVRIVRDKDTQLGKGFGYVQFSDRECVDEVLALEEAKLKFAKRKLRVMRCKSAPGAKDAVKISQKKEKGPTIVVPKGDPRLGERLHGLPKEERKQLKSSDADRVARRLAKKKARNSMAPGIGKSKAAGGKDRKRAR